ncbi:MAG: sigma-70 family RNA polymerase sigma factor [Isosphaeraceae bacterium]
MSSTVANDLRAIFDGGMVAGLIDGDLLTRFTSGSPDVAEPAFAALVARHGPMVLAACRSLLSNPHDAEDAFQATFLTLARKAATIRQPELIGPWLHGVACRTARRLREKDARRRRNEVEASMSRASEKTAAPDRDAIAALHEEIDRLPERYRSAIVLCDLNGLTHREAGRRLGHPTGTISARVARARARLRDRLLGRGLAFPAAAAGAVRLPGLPAPLANATVRIAMAASSATTAAIPPAVASLTREIMGFPPRLWRTSLWVVTLILGIGTIGMAVLARQDGARPTAPTAKSPTRPSAASDAPLPAGALLRLGTSRFRPPSIVAEMALSPDDATIVTMGDELIAWDAATGRERWRAPARDYGYHPPGAAYGVRALAFAPDGSRFFAPGHRGEIVAWETSSGRREVLRIPTLWGLRDDDGRDARSIDVAPDGRKLAFGDSSGVVVCDLNGKVLYQVPNGLARLFGGPQPFDNNDRLTFAGDYALARFSPDGQRLAVASCIRPMEIRMLDAETGRELRRIALTARPVRMAFSPDGRRIAATERDSAVRLYDAETGDRIWSIVIPLKNPRENYTSAIAFATDGRTIAVAATDHLIHLIDAKDGEDRAQLAGHHWYPWALAFAAKGDLLYSSGWDPAIRRWDVAARKQIPPPSGVLGSSVVAASPDGRTIAYEDDSGTVRLVDARDGSELRTLALAGAWYSTLAFSPDGRQLAAGGTVGDQVHVGLGDIPEGRLRHRWDWPRGRDPYAQVECLDFAPDGTRLGAVVFRQSSAYLFDLTDGRQVAHLPHNQVYGLSFSPDGRTIATAGWDEMLRFWDAESGDRRREIKIADRIRAGVGKANPAPGPVAGAPLPREDLRMFAVDHSPDGGLIATAHLDGKVRVWRADDMTLRTVFAVPSWFREGSMRFSPDGLWLATGVADGRIDLWDPSTGTNVWDRGRHQGDVYTVGFGRDSWTLVSGGQDGACYLWDTRPAGKPAASDPARLWDDLRGDDGAAAYRAVRTLAEIPDRAVPLLAGKLRPLTSVVDLDRTEPGLPGEETERRRRMKKLLIDKDPKLETAVGVRRAFSVLARVGTPEAIAVLDELATRDPNGEFGRLAAAAKERATRPAKP